jgi:hypothetical protein
MRSLRLADVRELLHGQPFAAWWSKWQHAMGAVREARAHHRDLLSQAELMALRSELVQRAAIDASSRAGDAERKRKLLAEEHPAAGRKRSRSSSEVDAAWGGSFERSLLGAEHGLVARRVKREAERLLQEAEERRNRAKKLAAEAEQVARELREAEERQKTLLAAARETLGCVPGTSFLYWRQGDDPRAALAVALADDPDGANIEVKALEIYTVRRQRGVAFLEPARDDGLRVPMGEGDGNREQPPPQRSRPHRR